MNERKRSSAGTGDRPDRMAPLEGTSVEVREADPADAAGVAAFLRRAWRQAGPEALGFTGATPELMASIARAAAIRTRIRRDGRRLFLARLVPVQESGIDIPA